MANYQELLSRAVGALPENNGASRREVYEKARKALVAQLRSISPPLPAREITQHRLELEDCIRQVEHDATELLLGELKGLEEETIPLVSEEVAAPVPAPAPVSAPEPALAAAVSPKAGAGKTADAPVADAPLADAPLADAPFADAPLAVAPPANSIDAIIARAEAARAEKVRQDRAPENIDGTRPDEERAAKESAVNEAAVNEAQAARDKAAQAAAREAEIAAKQAQQDRDETEALRKALEEDLGEEAVATRLEAAPTELESPAQTQNPAVGAAAESVTKSAAKSAAMSAVREVDLEGSAKGTVPVKHIEPGAVEPRPVEAPNVVSGVGAPVPAVSDPLVDDPKEDVAQLAVDRAIQTLDREARGEHEGAEGDELSGLPGQNGTLTSGEARYDPNADDEEKGGSGLTIFLVLAIILLGAVGGGGYWAWREGYVDLDALFASTEAPVPDVVAPTDAVLPGANDVQDPETANPIRNVTPQSENSGPGNTATDVEPVVTPGELESAADNNKSADRLVADGSDISEPAGGADKVEDRLITDPQPELSVGAPGTDTELSIAPSGAQSLLLEASADGTTGAVPFSGTVSWSRGVDELGQPTLIGEAKIPARNLGVKVLIRRNGDASLPASHLLEIDFDVSETFSGGSVAGLPGILLKNQELVQGTALIGASARVVGNSFLFALSASEQDVRKNVGLLEDNKWMDIAIIYSTGRRAIITLEKDDGAQAMFREVLAIWQAEAAGNG